MRYARQDGHCATCRGSARTALHERARSWFPVPGVLRSSTAAPAAEFLGKIKEARQLAAEPQSQFGLHLLPDLWKTIRIVRDCIRVDR